MKSVIKFLSQNWVVIGIICTIGLFTMTRLISSIYDKQNILQVNFSEHLAQHNLIMLAKASSLEMPLDFLRSSYRNYFVATKEREPSEIELNKIQTTEDYIKIIEQENRIGIANELLNNFSMQLYIFRTIEVALFIILIFSQINIVSGLSAKNY